MQLDDLNKEWAKLSQEMYSQAPPQDGGSELSLQIHLKIKN